MDSNTKGLDHQIKTERILVWRMSVPSMELEVDHGNPAVAE